MTISPLAKMVIGSVIIVVGVTVLADPAPLKAAVFFSAVLVAFLLLI